MLEAAEYRWRLLCITLCPHIHNYIAHTGACETYNFASRDSCYKCKTARFPGAKKPKLALRVILVRPKFTFAKLKS